MDEREAPERIGLIGSPFGWALWNNQQDQPATVEYVRADLTLRIPEPGSAEWEAMVERAWGGARSTGWSSLAMDAALRAALSLVQPHRENDKRPEG